MNPSLTTPPGIEPVTLAEAKAHLRIDHTDDDSLITELIVAARQYCEMNAGIAFVSQTWTWTLNDWLSHIRRPDADAPISELFSGGSARYAEVPRGPLASVASITTFDDDDVGTVWSTTNYYVAAAQNRIYRRVGAAWPIPARTADGIEIVYVAGFGAAAADVPGPLRRAVLLMAAHLYERRVPVADAASVYSVPLGLPDLLSPYRRRGL